MLNPLSITPEEFLQSFFDPGETVCLRVFDDKKQGVFRGSKLECEAGKIGGMLDVLRKHNAQGRGIYFVINHGGHEDAEITRINAQFVECDSKTLAEQEAAITAFPLPPSLVVRTRKSLHCYWLVKDARVDQFRRVQKGLIAHFYGDPACVNESRVFRLPGFYHCKEEPVMVACVKFSPELRYTQAQLMEALPVVPVEPAPAIASPMPKGARKGLAVIGKRCDFIRYCRENAGTLPENLWYAMITNLAVFEDGDKMIHTLSKDYPKYSRAETEDKIAHFLHSNTKPMTCAKIGEIGFKCPKLESGHPGSESCGCKSPAALCYRPLNVETLRAFLAESELKDSPLENMQEARLFVAEYLYNADGVLAPAFIENDLREHYGFKAGALKPLLVLYRELYKAYKDHQDTRREAAGEGKDLPDWYEITERGGLRFVSGILADYMAKNVEAFYGAGTYFFYDGGVYNMADELVAGAKARSYMIPRYATMSAITDAVGQWRMLIRREIREINANPFIINVKNGLYNVLDGSLKEHMPDYYSTVQINADYDPSAHCPLFLEFLTGILHDEEVFLLQEIFGYLLIPVNKAQKSFVLVGAPNAGKSTLLSIAQEVLLGSANVSNIPWQGLGDRFNKAELFGKLANIFADLPSKNIDDGGMFKALTGEDYITAERKNKDPFSFRPYARLLFSCNEIPRNYSDRSDGFYRRLVIIRFDRSVPPEKRDPNLRERLAVERDGILMWAMEGLRRLIDNSYLFTETQRTRDEVTRYRIESNSVLTFLDEFCVTGDGWTAREELYSRYKDFCAASGYKTQSQMSFNKEIEANFPDIRRGQDKVSGRKVWRGINFLEGGKE